MKFGIHLILTGLLITMVACEKNSESLTANSEEFDFSLELEALATADYQYEHFTDVTFRDPKHKGRRDSTRHGGGARGMVITFDELPVDAQTYINTNYAQDLIRRIVKVTDSLGVVRYVVALQSGVLLFFDANGVFIEKKEKVDRHEQVLFSDLPQLVQESILANYDTATISHYYKLTLPDGTVLYVFRTDDGKRVAMNESGVVVAEKKRRRK
ncbi:MAG TPA: hypothetical protein PK006_00835 [Saprospiraceae bacterium]|nr:hypothetical protein [Saprospiraceae bacterium]